MFAYLDDEDEGYQAVELALEESNLAVLLLIPDSGHYQQFKDALDLTRIQGIISMLEPQEVTVSLPRFSFTSDEFLRNTLSAMGMTEAMLEADADFSGANPADDLYMNGIRCTARIDVFESGAEAPSSAVVTMKGRKKMVEVLPGITAAWDFATGLVMWHGEPYVIPAIGPSVSRPFLFVVRDTESDVILFLGRVVDPRN
jgi:serpin B